MKRFIAWKVSKNILLLVRISCVKSDCGKVTTKKSPYLDTSHRWTEGIYIQEMKCKFFIVYQNFIFSRLNVIGEDRFDSMQILLSLISFSFKLTKYYLFSFIRSYKQNFFCLVWINLSWLKKGSFQCVPSARIKRFL